VSIRIWPAKAWVNCDLEILYIGKHYSPIYYVLDVPFQEMLAPLLGGDATKQPPNGGYYVHYI
jgi:hypothetical protein